MRFQLGRLASGRSCVPVVVVLVSLTLAFGTVASTYAKDKEIVVPALSGKALAGKEVYSRNCQSCHGINTAGTDKGPTFLHRVYHPGHHSDASVYIAVRQGSRQHHWRFGNMKPIAGISDAEVAEVIAYIRAMQRANGVF